MSKDILLLKFINKIGQQAIEVPQVQWKRQWTSNKVRTKHHNLNILSGEIVISEISERLMVCAFIADVPGMVVLFGLEGASKTM
jgi:hypothetical protein